MMVVNAACPAALLDVDMQLAPYSGDPTKTVWARVIATCGLHA